MRGTRFRRMINWWPPLVGAGIKVVELDDHYWHVKVRLRMNRLNRNMLGTHFGGSLFAMTDPFLVIMLVNHLGRDHVVWDKSAEIDFVSPGRGDVFTQFTLTPGIIEELRSAAADGSKVLRWFTEDIVDSDGALVATVRKQLYVRRRRDAAAAVPR